MDSPSVPAVPDTIHVLLVDDEQLSRFVVGNLLRKCNYAGGCGWEAADVRTGSWQCMACTHVAFQGLVCCYQTPS